MNNRLFVLSAVLLIGLGASRIASADGDVLRGKTVFGRCIACHAVDGKNGVGPHLDGVFGRPAGKMEGFHYSRNLAASTMVWDDKNLDNFLSSPTRAIPGTTMPINVPSAQDRVDLIAFLKTLGTVTK